MKKQKLFSLLIVAISIASIQSCQLKRIDIPCPTITSLSPNAARFGDTVSIIGTNFIAGSPGRYTVSIAGTNVPVIDVNSTTLRFKVPTGIGSGPLTVTLDRLSNCTSNAKDFTYYYKATMVNKLTGTYTTTPNCILVTDNCLNSPTGIDLDLQGNLVVADKGNYVVRKINSSTGAIDGTYGIFKPTTLPCDGSTVTNSTMATFFFPYDVEVDSSTGNIYVAEEFNKLIRVLTPNVTGAATILAGSCQLGGSPGACGATGTITTPHGLSKNGNKLYCADNGNIRMIDLSTSGSCTSVTTTLTHGPGQYFRALEVSYARSNQGQIFIADDVEGNIKVISLAGGATMTTLSMSPASLNQPVALTVDRQGNIFIADKANNRIYVLYVNGDLVPLAGTGTLGYVDGTEGLSAQFRNPSGLALDESKGILYIADTGNNVIRKLILQ